MRESLDERRLGLVVCKKESAVADRAKFHNGTFEPNQENARAWRAVCFPPALITARAVLGERAPLVRLTSPPLRPRNEPIGISSRRKKRKKKKKKARASTFSTLASRLGRPLSRAANTPNGGQFAPACKHSFATPLPIPRTGNKDTGRGGAAKAAANPCRVHTRRWPSPGPRRNGSTDRERGACVNLALAMGENRLKKLGYSSENKRAQLDVCGRPRLTVHLKGCQAERLPRTQQRSQ